MIRFFLKFSFFFLLLSLQIVPTADVSAQTELQIVAPERGYRTAVPNLCNLDRAVDYVERLARLIRDNLSKSPLFYMIDSASYPPVSSCEQRQGGEFSSWRSINTELLITGTAKVTGVDTPTLEVELFLYDVNTAQALIGRQYTAQIREADTIAHKFSNAVLEYFSGKSGVYGSKIAYIERIATGKELFVMDFNGENVQQLTNDKSITLSPSWSSDGNEILYLSYKGKKPDLYRYLFTNKRHRKVTDWSGALIGAKYMNDNKSIIAGARISGLLQILEFNRQGGFVRKITNDTGINISPTLSPDGNMIAYVSTSEAEVDGGPQIYVRSLAGGGARRISFTKSNYCTSPSWSPDGETIAFVCEKDGSQIFISSANGGQAVQLTFAGNNESPSWSPDGKSFVYSSDFGEKGVANIGLFSVVQFNSWRLTTSENEQSQPVWGP